MEQLTTQQSPKQKLVPSETDMFLVYTTTIDNNISFDAALTFCHCWIQEYRGAHRKTTSSPCACLAKLYSDGPWDLAIKLLKYLLDIFYAKERYVKIGISRRNYFKRVSESPFKIIISTEIFESTSQNLHILQLFVKSFFKPNGLGNDFCPTG